MILTPVTQRVAALGLLSLFISGIWAFLFDPIVDRWTTGRSEIEKSLHLLAAYQHIQAEIPTIEHELTALQQDGAAADLFLQGANSAIITAKLQDDVQRIAASAGVALRASQTLPMVAAGDFQQIGIQLDMGLSSPQLQRLLYGIETAPLALFVNKLSVRVPENGLTQKAADGQTLLNVRLEVTGFSMAKPR